MHEKGPGREDFDGLVEDWGNSIANALELPQLILTIDLKHYYLWGKCLQSSIPLISLFGNNA